jgi:hypothetical protein
MIMQRLKKISVILFIFSIVFALASCSPESAVEKATDGAVDIDKKGNIEIKDKDGGKVKIGEAEWEKSKMHGMDAPKAKLDSFISSNEGTSYMFSEMKDKDIDAYIEKIKKEGFTYNFVSVDEYNYTGTNEDGLIFSFSYDKETNSGMISATKGEKPDSKSGTIFEGENAEWDSSKVGEIPDPKVNITSFTSSGNDVSYGFEKLDDPKGYIEKIKEAGFTENSSIMESSDGYMYTGANSNGDMVYFTANADGCLLVYTKSSE